MGAAEGIKHVIVLMLENRSFDCMLGRLYLDRPGFEGLTLNETNLFNGVPVKVWTSHGLNDVSACIPTPNPGEHFTDMTEQLFGTGGAWSGDPAPMSGFIANYMAQPASAGPYDPASVMHYFTPEQVPIISGLAWAFGVCDQWYASAPCQTWPNRFFAHTATARGHVDNSQFHIPFLSPSIFGRLKQHGKSWRVYFHDAPHSILLGDVWLDAPLRFRPFGQFIADAHTGELPNYSFIEPRYFTDFQLGIPNDEHPPHNIGYGEELIATVYNAVRSSPNWKESLLIITYDEHGGCYDHVPPPKAVSPDGRAFNGFTFASYGVRVPTIIISPYVAAGSIIKAAPGGVPHAGPPYPFDHTSIIATLRKLFDLGEPFTRRDEVAPDLIGALSLDAPTNDGPVSLPVRYVRPSLAEVKSLAAAPPNHLQYGLTLMAAQLPAAPLDARGAVPEPQPPAPRPFENVIQAASDTVGRVRAFLGT